MTKIKSSTFGGLMAEEMMQQRRWWRNLGQITEDLKAISKQGPAGAALAERVSGGINARIDNASEALTLMGRLLGHPGILQIVADALNLDPRVQINSLEALWVAARDEADYLFRGHATSPLRDDYHPLLRDVWDGYEESATALVLRFIARIPEARNLMQSFGWELPAEDAPAEQFDAHFADLCEAAAGPGLRRRA